MSKARPIHTIHRTLDETPHEAEPSFSYERNSFLLTAEEALEDEFHRKLATSTGRGGGGGGKTTTTETSTMAGNSSSTTTYHSNMNGGNGFNLPTNANGGGGNSSSHHGKNNGGVSSFWRTKGTPASPAISIGKGSSRGSNHVSLNLGRQVSESLSNSTHSRTSTINTAEYNSGRASRSISGGGTTSGGGIAAALMLSPQPHSDLSQRSRSVPSPSDHDYHHTPSSSSSRHPSVVKRSSSAMSQNSNKKKNATKARAQARRLKYDQMQGLDVGHEMVDGPEESSSDYMMNSNNNGEHYEPLRQDAGAMMDPQSDHSASLIFGNIMRPNTDSNIRNTSFGTVTSGSQTSTSASLDSTIIHSRMGGGDGGGGGGGGQMHNERSISGSTAGNTTSGGSSVLFGKSSSLIFPTGVDPPVDGSQDNRAYNHKRHKINTLLDACDCMRFPFKKKLILSNLDLTAADVPVKDLYNTSLGNSLHKLSLAGNPLTTVPPKLVTCLPVLKNLDLSQCGLHQIPDQWNLPQLKRLNLSHNRLTDFPEETMLEGLLELQELNMYGNKVSDIIVPQNPKLLAKLELLNLGYNDLSYLPEDLDSLKSLRTLKVMNNLLELIRCEFVIWNSSRLMSPVIPWYSHRLKLVNVELPV